MDRLGTLIDEKADINTAQAMGLALLVISILTVLASSAVLGNSSENLVSSKSPVNLKLSVLDAKTLKLEHLGGDPIDFSGSAKANLYLNGSEYELSVLPKTGLLEVGGSKRLLLPEGVNLKTGDSITISIVGKDNLRIYGKELQVS